jgi:hypothetical protein
MAKKKTKASANSHVDVVHGNGNGKVEEAPASRSHSATSVEELSVQVDAQTAALLKLTTQLASDVTQLRHESGEPPLPLATT